MSIGYVGCEQGDVMSDIWQQEKNLTKAARVLGEKKSHLHTRESTAKTKVMCTHTNTNTEARVAGSEFSLFMCIQIINALSECENRD